MSALYLFDQHDQEQQQAIDDYEDMQEAWKLAQVDKELLGLNRRVTELFQRRHYARLRKQRMARQLNGDISF